MKVKEESEKVGFKLNIQKTKNMASPPITSWQIDGETMETVTDFILGGEGNGNPLQYSCLENPHGQRSLASYSPWGHNESDMTK